MRRDGGLEVGDVREHGVFGGGGGDGGPLVVCQYTFTIDLADDVKLGGGGIGVPIG